MLPRLFSVLRAVLAALCFVPIVACGGEPRTDSLPRSIEELQDTYLQTAPTLCSYFSRDDKKEMRRCRSINPDVRMKGKDGDLLWDASLRIWYHDEMILKITQAWVMPSADHGFTSSGKYLIFVNEFGRYTALPHLFVDGTEVAYPVPGEKAIYYVDVFRGSWLVLQSSPPYWHHDEPPCNWALYNIETMQFIDYGGADTCIDKVK